jgi:hypothetical protein
MQQLVAELARPVVLSDHALRQLAPLREVHAAHLRRHGREPTAHELAAASGIDRPDRPETARLGCLLSPAYASGYPHPATPAGTSVVASPA